MKRGAYLLNLGVTPYLEAWEVQRALAAAVSQGAIPDTVILLEHPPVITLGRRTDGGAELHVRDLEESVIRTVGAFGLAANRIEGLTGVWLESPPRKICSIGVHIARWVTTHGYALNVDLDPAPFTEWITACGLEDAAFTTISRELGRPVAVDEVRPRAAAAVEEVFGLTLEELPAGDGAGLWPQPVHERISAKPMQSHPRSGEAVGVEQVVAGS